METSRKPVEGQENGQPCTTNEMTFDYKSMFEGIGE